jgi:L-alanine-DL-glutamate epimerase-like enolase superfamily enzyme
MKITRIDYHVLVVPDVNTGATSSAQDNLVVEVHTDEGIVGVGETDVNPWIGRECLRARGTHSMGQGIEELLIGADPLRPDAIWQRLYTATKMNGRRGALICALGAVDMALWDIAGKALGLPIHALLGGAVKERITPYASLLGVGTTLADYRRSLVAKLVQAKEEYGYRAAKLEIGFSGPYAHNGIEEPDEAVAEVVAACREAVGAGFVLMVDLLYAFSDPKRALRVIRQIEPYDIFFVETPLDIDDLDGHAFLVDHSPIRIAAGEWQNTHWEFLDLADRARLDVLAHLCAATACCPYIEFLPAPLSESALRRELVTEDLALVDGSIPVPQRPGLGVELNRDALARYRAD